MIWHALFLLGRGAGKVLDAAIVIVAAILGIFLLLAVAGLFFPGVAS